MAGRLGGPSDARRGGQQLGARAELRARLSASCRCLRQHPLASACLDAHVILKLLFVCAFDCHSFQRQDRHGLRGRLALLPLHHRHRRHERRARRLPGAVPGGRVPHGLTGGVSPHCNSRVARRARPVDAHSLAIRRRKCNSCTQLGARSVVYPVSQPASQSLQQAAPFPCPPPPPPLGSSQSAESSACPSL